MERDRSPPAGLNRKFFVKFVSRQVGEWHLLTNDVSIAIGIPLSAIVG
jgi:hypothetical protein